MHCTLLKLCKTLALIENIFDFMDYIVVIIQLHLAHVVFLMSYIRKILYIWLQLFEKDETQGDQRLWLNFLQVFSLLDSVNVKENIILFLQ